MRTIDPADVLSSSSLAELEEESSAGPVGGGVGNELVSAASPAHLQISQPVSSSTKPPCSRQSMRHMLSPLHGGSVRTVTGVRSVGPVPRVGSGVGEVSAQTGQHRPSGT